MRKDLYDILDYYSVNSSYYYSSYVNDFAEASDDLFNSEDVIYADFTEGYFINTRNNEEEDIDNCIYIVTNRRIIIYYEHNKYRYILDLTHVQMLFITPNPEKRSSGVITIITPSKIFNLYIEKDFDTIVDIAGLLQKNLIDFKNKKSKKSSTDVNKSIDVVSKIEQIAVLKAKGIINQDEYNKKKKELLSRL